MTVRERFQRVMAFQPVDQIPAVEWASWWDLTLRNWAAQGLDTHAEGPHSMNASVAKRLGLDPMEQYWIPFHTPQTPRAAVHGGPLIANESDYEKLLPTLYPQNAVSRERLEQMAALQHEGGAITWITLEGFFWGPRSLLGIEPHLFSFYDEPELYHRICGDIARYNLHVLDQVLDVFAPDFMTFAEDMNYNNGPMLSEELFDTFMAPYYHLIIPGLKERGVRVLIDSDGDISRSLPWFARAGIEGILPLERQAGVDLSALRKQYPRFLFLGHFDKMVMPHGEEAMRGEFERLLPVMRQGGFIPSVDHQTPPSVTLQQYHVYVRLLREYCAKAGIGG